MLKHQFHQNVIPARISLIGDCQRENARNDSPFCWDSVLTNPPRKLRICVAPWVTVTVIYTNCLIMQQQQRAVQCHQLYHIWRHWQLISEIIHAYSVRLGPGVGLFTRGRHWSLLCLTSSELYNSPQEQQHLVCGQSYLLAEDSTFCSKIRLALLTSLW